MARRKITEPSPIEVRQLTIPEIDGGIKKIKRRNEEVRALDPRVVSFDDARVQNVESNIRDTIREVFGHNSPEFKEHGNHIIWRDLESRPFEDNRQAQFAAGIPQTITVLEGLIERLEEKREDAIVSQTTPMPSLATMPGTRRVFVVHGRDEAAKESVARFLEKLNLQPIILHEQPNQGRTVIEKFENHTDVDFAVILLTPDDVGYPADEPEKAQSRARQNVVFELGYFFGKLGRSRVCALHKGKVEILSDYEGIIHVSMDDPRGWRVLLAKEINAAGIEINLNLAL